MGLRCLLVVGVIAGAGLVAAVSPAAVTSPPAAPIVAVAGLGSSCSTPPNCGDGGPATAAQLSYPVALAVGPSGNVYVVDWGDNEVREVSPTGTITTVAGGGVQCGLPPSCGDGGAATDAELDFPEGVAVDRAGNVYIADTGDNEVRKVSTKGIITRLAGTGVQCSQPPACGDGGLATAAQLSSPTAVAVDRAGNVYIADTGDNEVRKVSPSGQITTVAGNGVACSGPPSCGDTGPATAAEVSFPEGVAVDQAGALFIADTGDNEVRKVSPAGTITRLAGTGALCANPTSCGDGGAATSAKLSGPDGVAVDTHGNVYVADAGDNKIRLVSAAGRMSTLAGNGTACVQPPACGDGGAAVDAQLDYPEGVAVDAAADVYIADTYDQEIRWMPATGSVILQGPNGAFALSAFGPTVTGRAVTVRYALSGAAAVTLAVSGPGQPSTVVVRASGRPGFRELTWNRTVHGKPAKRGRYTLTVTAAVGGHTASSRVSVRL